MPLIVNLSAILAKRDVSHIIEALALLHFEYGQSCCRPSMFYSRLWVKARAAVNRQLIDNYKLGKVITEAFIAQALAIFPFLGKGPEAERRFVDAWNAISQLEENTSVLKLHALLAQCSANNPLYFIANTNALNAQSIFEQFEQEGCSLMDKKKLLDTTGKRLTEPLEVGDNIYVYFSYHVGMRKTDDENQGDDQQRTPGLLRALIKHLITTGHTQFHVVSQHRDDITLANRLASQTQDPSVSIQVTNSAQFFSELALSTPGPAIKMKQD